MYHAPPPPVMQKGKAGKTGKAQGRQRGRHRGAAPDPAGGDNLPRAPGKGNAGEIIPPAPPCFFQLAASARGNAGEVRSPRRRPQAGGIHFRRQAQRTSCKSRVRTACPGQTGVGGTREKEKVIISPGPPWFFQLFIEDGGTQKPSPERKGHGGRRKGRKARRALFGLHTQCRRVLPHPPAVADRCSASRSHRCG